MSLQLELIAARARLASQRDMCAKTESAFNEALARGLVAVQKSLAVKLARQRDAVVASAAMVAELEGALGSPGQVDLVDQAKRKPR